MRRPQAAQWFAALASERFSPWLRTERVSESGERAANRRGSRRHRGVREHAAQPLVRRVAVHARVPDLDVAELGELDRRRDRAHARDLREAPGEAPGHGQHHVGMLDGPGGGGEIGDLELHPALQALLVERVVDDALAAFRQRHHGVRIGQKRSSVSGSRPIGWRWRTRHKKPSRNNTWLRNSLGALLTQSARSSALVSSRRKTVSVKGEISSATRGANLVMCAMKSGKTTLVA